MDVATFTATPSRYTAEPVERQERERLLERTTRDGFVDDYRGVRITSSGKRFQILVQRHPEWHELNAKIVGLYREIADKALENETSKKDTP